MASLWYGNTKYCNTMCKYSAFTSVGTPILPSLQSPPADARGFMREARSVPRGLYKKDEFRFSRKESSHKVLNKRGFVAPRSSNSSNSSGSSGDLAAQDNTTFGYTRKDVLLIGLGVTLFGIGLKSGLEVARVNPLQAGNVVRLVLVLGLTVGWISTYIFRVSNKEMTYAQQLHDYENKVMQKLLEGLTEAELEALLEQVEEEKRRLASGEQIN